ncbi:hypothetical protein SRABI118_01008 [Massilia sp. Bi118]|uniref:DUF1631 family protein n=1 Tax=Massilia sp. Bi118 TaxID=2822346 RepID=UPI001D9B3BD5|nr:DUF1631 family protein [Massilia sp. Bi118]CAH0171553.1 hypothetical protein SRABI118_01008 [Massilia sp. Bi118]
MSSSRVQSPAARQAALQKQATLDALADIAAAQLKEQLTPMIARFGAALADVSQPGLDTREVYRRVRSSKLLRDNSYAFFHLASTGLDLAVRQDIERLQPQGAAPRAAPASLSLVPLEVMDDKVAFGAITRPFDIAHSEQLATLSVRLGLLLGKGVLRADANPFRPEVFLKALEEAWREFEPEEESHPLILELLRPELVFDFGALYEALVEGLTGKDGQGAVEAYRIQKTDDAAAARAARASGKAALAEQLRKLFGDEDGAAVPDLPLIPELPAMPSGAGGWRPSAAAGFAAAPVEQGEARQAPVEHPAAVQAAQPAGGFLAAAGGATFGATAGAAPGAAPGGAPSAGGIAAGASFMMAPGVMAAAQASGAVHAGGFAAGGLPAIPGLPHDAPVLVPGQVAPLLELLARIEPGLQAAQSALDPSSGAIPAAAGALPQNVFYLPRFAQSLPKGSLSRGDESTLGLLSRVFETVLLDDSIPPQTRELLRVLQVPVLKAALLDKNFFFEEAHPARRMVDLLSRMGWEQRKDQDDPLFQVMQRSVERVGEDRPGAFAEAVAELEAGIAAEENAQQEAIAAPVASALKQEKMQVATRAARDAVQLRVQAGDVGQVVSGFLEQRWTTVMTFAYSIDADKPGAVVNATRAMDELIWSVKPKQTQEQRKALIGKLPRLLATLNKWLDAIRWQDAERLQFFARLAECHASIVRAPIELSPERQLELAVEAAQQDALRRVELEQAAAGQEAARQQMISPVDGLERGMWFEFKTTEGARKVKLAWVSPLRTLFIFSGAGRREAFSLSAEKFAELLHAGAARVLAIDGVVGQVLSEAMQAGAVNDASMKVAAA